VIRQRISCPTSLSISAASRTPLRDAGRNALIPTSTVSPPFTTPVTVPPTTVRSANAFSIAPQSFGCSTRARESS